MDSYYYSHKEDIIELVSDKFERKLTEEISKVKIEIADLRAEVKSEIASQTKWIFGALISVVVLLPVMLKLLDKLFP